MCGITGIVRNDRRDVDEALLARMCASIRHRGPDDDGFYVKGPVGLGMRRLAIIDLKSGQQPIHNQDRTAWIVFNGEIYNHAELREQLLARGHRYKTHSDTETIIHLYEEYGRDCVRHLRGMFAFAIWDKRARKLFIARDRLGIKPLYYGHVEGSFVFASELKTFKTFPGFQAAIDRDSLAAYMRCAYVPAPHSIYEGIHKLPPSHILTLSSIEASPVLSAYWSAAKVARNGVESRLQGGDEEIIEQLREKLADAVRLRSLIERWARSHCLKG